MSLVKRIALPLVVVAAVGALGASVAFGSASTGKRVATKSLTIDVRLIQEATFQCRVASLCPGWNPRPPAPNPGGKVVVLSTSLHLYAVGEQLGLPSGTYLGTMSFTYELLKGASCGTSAPGCSGNTDLQTVTSFPGGSITAGGSHIGLGVGLVVPIEHGSGIFKNVTGSISIAPNDQAVSIYRLTMPS